MLTLDQIQIRDSFVLPVPEEGCYYLYGTTDKDPWNSPGVGFDTYRSSDLVSWDGPFPAFRPPADFWADRNFWAPEVHRYRDAYYMFASFKSNSTRRGTQVLKADSPLGPFVVHSSRALTPPDWECLDGTLYVDRDSVSWMVFCHEWVQIQDGTVCAQRLSDDLTQAAGEPITLFSASEAPWTIAHHRKDGSVNERDRVTDGPFLYQSPGGRLFMVWSSFSRTGYTAGVAWSESGEITGPWVQQHEPLAENDAGHGMLFRNFAGELYLALHAPNKTPEERPVFIPVVDDGKSLHRR